MCVFYDYLRNILFDYIGFSFIYCLYAFSIISYALPKHLFPCKRAHAHSYQSSCLKERSQCCCFMATSASCFTFCHFYRNSIDFASWIVCISFDSPFMATQPTGVILADYCFAFCRCASLPSRLVPKEFFLRIHQEL